MEFEVTSVNGNAQGWHVQGLMFIKEGEVKTPTNKYLSLSNLSKDEALKYEVGDVIPV